jgi:arginase family enzyme
MRVVFGSNLPFVLHHDPNWPRASEWLRSGSGDIAVLGAPLNRSISPGRCDLAPDAVRAALTFFSPHSLGVGPLPAVCDHGNLPLANLSPEEAFPLIRQALRERREADQRVILLGGDNGVTRPGVHGLGLSLQRCGLITLDAHFDLRDTTGGLHNGNPVRALLEDGLPGANIAQIGLQSFANSETYHQVAITHGIHIVSRSDCFDIEQVCVATLRRMDVDQIYLDIDLDVMDRAFAPGCPGARPGGLTPHELRSAIATLCQDPRVTIVDIVEYDPERDVGDLTALAAAACLLEVVAAWAA